MAAPLSAATFREWIADFQWEIRRCEGSRAFRLQQGNYHNCIGNICLTYAPEEAPPAFMEALRIWRQMDQPSNLVVAVLWKLGHVTEMAAECMDVLAAHVDLAGLSGNDLASNERVSARPIGARNQLVAANAFLGRWDAALQELDRYSQAVGQLRPGKPGPHEEGLRRTLLALAQRDSGELVVGLTALQPRVGLWPPVAGTLDAELFRFLVCAGDQGELVRRHAEAEPWRERRKTANWS